MSFFQTRDGSTISPIGSTIAKTNFKSCSSQWLELTTFSQIDCPSRKFNWIYNVQLIHMWKWHMVFRHFMLHFHMWFLPHFFHMITYCLYDVPCVYVTTYEQCWNAFYSHNPRWRNLWSEVKYMWFFGMGETMLLVLYSQSKCLNNTPIYQESMVNKHLTKVNE